MDDINEELFTDYAMEFISAYLSKDVNILSDLFKSSKISHELLNAKPENVTRESEIIAQAGKKYAVTIATSMAGRGTDIILGGNPLFQIREKLKSKPNSNMA